MFDYIRFLIILPSIYSIYIPPNSDGTYSIKKSFLQSAINFTILGDWGGFPAPWYHTPYQTSSAKLLNKISDIENNQFTLAIGDNFYYYGVKNIYDRAWHEVWDSTYTSKGLQTPWYAIMGNHDYQGNASAQLIYSKYNNRWTFPNYWYSLDVELGGENRGDTKTKTKAKFLMFDSQAHCDAGKSQTINTQYTVELTEENKQNQLNWLKNELKNIQKNDDYDFVFFATHYPVDVIWKTRHQYECMSDVKDLLVESKITAIFCGHEHMMWHTVSEHDGEYQLHEVLSGMGSLMGRKEERDIDENKTKFVMANIIKMKGGFVTAELSNEKIEFRYYYAGVEKGQDEIVYKFEIPKRRR